MEFTKNLLFAYVCDYINPDPFLIFDKQVKIKLDISENEIKKDVEAIVFNFLDQYNQKFVYMNGASEIAFDSNALKFKTGILRFKDGFIKKCNSNMLDLNFISDFKSELFFGLYSELARFGYHDAITNKNDIEFSEPIGRDGFIPVKFLASIGKEGLKVHKVFVRWMHNGYYSSTCASCQTGVAHFMHSLNAINNRLFVSKDSKKKDGGKSWICGDVTFELKDAVKFPYTQVYKMADMQDILNYISQMNVGSVEMSHIAKIQLIDANNNVFEVDGTDE